MKKIATLLAVYVTCGVFWNLSTGHLAQMHQADIILYAICSLSSVGLFAWDKKRSLNSK